MLLHCLCVSATVTEALLSNVRRGPPSGPQALQAYSLTLQDTPKGSRHSCHKRKPEPRDTEVHCVASHSKLAAAQLRTQECLMPSQPPPLGRSAASGALEAFTLSRLNSSLLDLWTAARPRYTEARVHFGQLSFISEL